MRLQLPDGWESEFKLAVCDLVAVLHERLLNQSMQQSNEAEGNVQAPSETLRPLTPTQAITPQQAEEQFPETPSREEARQLTQIAVKARVREYGLDYRGFFTSPKPSWWPESVELKYCCDMTVTELPLVLKNCLFVRQDGETPEFCR